MGTFGNQNIQFFIEFPIGTGPKKGVHWNTLSVCQSALGKSSKNKLSFYGQADRKGGGVSPLGPDRKQMCKIWSNFSHYEMVK